MPVAKAAAPVVNICRAPNLETIKAAFDAVAVATGDLENVEDANRENAHDSLIDRKITEKVSLTK
jgi:hypothetical protein